MPKDFISIDLFSGCGGLTAGLKKAGFKTKLAVEIEANAVRTYRLNHRATSVIQDDIRKVDIEEIKKMLDGQQLHLLAGCPPCQGFSTIRRLNKKKNVHDSRNALLLEYLRFVRELNPYTIMLENVPGLINYYQFRSVVKQLRMLGYTVQYEVLNVKDYGVPQSRKRLVLLGSRLGDITVANSIDKPRTVRDAIGNLEYPNRSKDPLHKLHAKHSPWVKRLISLIPKNGGSRDDLPSEFELDCHKKEGIGFRDVYGRLRWDDVSSTITGGCLNPSKGRFLHPSQNRVITVREAALLQTFPASYRFLPNIPKQELALMIGNALPPLFSYYQAKNIKSHLTKHLG